MAKGKRTTIEPNIYQYPNGNYEAIVRVTGCKPQHKIFTPDTTLTHIRAWVSGCRDDCHDELRAFGDIPAQDRARAAGTLEGDAPNYWSQTAGRPSSRSDRSHLRAWFEVVVDGVRLGSLARDKWTAGHVNKAIAQWQAAPSPHAIRKVRVGGYTREAVTVESYAIKPAAVRTHDRAGAQAGIVTSYVRRGSTIAAHQRPGNAVEAYERTAPATSGLVVAALTIRHRCRVLEDLYHTLDGKRAPTPVDEAKIPKRSKKPPVTVPIEVIEKTLRTLSQTDRQTFGRFAVVNTCAQRPCQVGRAQPDDVNILDRSWLVRDAKGEPAHTITLDDPQVAAWEAFIVADAWGPIDTTKYGRIIHEAGWPKGIRPYAARHSFAANAIRSGVSLGDLQALLGHKDPATTRIYAPFQIDRQRVVSAQVKDYLADVFKLRLVK